MWKFKAEQKIVQIGNIKFGGNPEERIPVLIGSIFYKGHNIITDQRTGDFDREKAEALIKLQEEFSDKTGIPHVIDVVGENEEVMEKYLEFVTSVTDSVIAVDGTVSNVRIHGVEYAKSYGIKNPIIYNSLMEPREDELSKLRELNVSNAILLCYNLRNFTSVGRVEMAKELVDKAKSYGIKNLLIDTMVLDIPSLGSALRAIHIVKDEIGLPVGCGAHNAVGLWRGAERKLGKQVIKPANVAASVMAIAAGADFVLYGPIDHADVMFPVVGMMSASYAQIAIEDKKKLPAEHPRYKIA
jgi:tetrahydromethanopterin S-methyltransferase subunit H